MKRDDTREELTGIGAIKTLLRLQVLLVAVSILKDLMLYRRDERRAAPGDARPPLAQSSDSSLHAPAMPLAARFENIPPPVRIARSTAEAARAPVPARRRLEGALIQGLRSGGQAMRSPVRLLGVAVVAFVVASIFVSPINSLWSKSLIVQGKVDVGAQLQGCSPGYWKNHRDRWDGQPPPSGGTPDYTQNVHYSDPFNAAFGVTPEQSGHADSNSLRDAIRTGGGGKIALGRLAAAHLANADSAELPGYPYTVQQVKDTYVGAIQTVNDPGTPQDENELAIQIAAGKFDAAQDGTSSAECPLGGDPTSTVSESMVSAGPVSGGTVPASPQAQPRLTPFEVWAGIGVLPAFPELCSGMSFDTVFVIDEPGTYESLDQRDLVFGSPGDDRIESGGGADCVGGYGGDDVIRTGPGNDVAFAGAGTNRIDGGDGNDLIIGGDGQDNLEGGPGGDYLVGHEGDDRIHGGDGNDTIDGALGADLCAGDAGSNTITQCEAPPGPAALSATFDAATQTVTLTWEPVAGASGYNIYRSTLSGGGPDALWVAQGSTGASIYGDTVSSETATYYYIVTGVDGDGFESAHSAEIKVVTAPGVVEPTVTPSPAPTGTPTPPPPPTDTPTAVPSPTPEPEASPTTSPTASPTPEAA